MQCLRMLCAATSGISSARVPTTTVLTCDRGTLRTTSKHCWNNNMQRCAIDTDCIPGGEGCISTSTPRHGGAVNGAGLADHFLCLPQIEPEPVYSEVNFAETLQMNQATVRGSFRSYHIAPRCDRTAPLRWLRDTYYMGLTRSFLGLSC